MSYIALYRKFRPQTFDQVKGQDHVVRALKNQLQNNRTGHAYLFVGTRGTGKTSVARIFAKAVNCLDPVNGEPCNECENCRAITAGSFVDVIEVDAASNNGVDDIRRIIEEVRYTPVKGKYKVYIIDEAHMITGAAFNAFLKTLEEPPSYAIFILATTEPHMLPVTILSRCQRYDFRRITTDEIAANLFEITQNEGTEADEKALRFIARAGDGSMRDSISLLDKCIAFNLGSRLTYENVLDTLGTVDTEEFSKLFRNVYSGNVSGALGIVDEAVAEGRDLTRFATDFIWYIRNLLMVRAADIKDPDVLGISAENMKKLTEDASGADISVMMRYIRILSELIDRIRYSANKQVLLEVGIIKLAKPQTEADTESLADRIRQLEAAYAAGPVMASDHYDTVMTRSELSVPADDPAFDWEPFPAEEPVFQADPGTEYQEFPEPEHHTAGQKNILEEMTGVCDNPRIRATLNKCSADEADGTVRIYAPNEFAMKMLKGESEFLKQLAAKALGREADIMVMAGSEGSRTAEKMNTGFPEELLKNINFNIGTEEW